MTLFCAIAEEISILWPYETMIEAYSTIRRTHCIKTVFDTIGWEWYFKFSSKASNPERHPPDNWRAGCKNLVSDNFARFSVLLKTSPNFASRLEMNLRTLPWYFFYRCELYFWEISYAKTLSASGLKTMESAKRHLPFIVRYIRNCRKSLYR